MSGLTERTLDSQELFKGNFLHAFRDRVELPDGATATREYVVHPGAVMVVPLIHNAQGDISLLLERQFRYPMGKVMIEFPAGKLDAGEACFTCAQRELQEETGFVASEWAHAGVLHPVIAYSTEFIDIWFARGLEPGPRQLDDGEFIEVFTVSPKQFFDWCLDGQITDGKTLAAGLWLQNVLSGQWPLQWQTAQQILPTSSA
jgi:ADP-ribose pyrophosphatase